MDGFIIAPRIIDHHDGLLLHIILIVYIFRIIAYHHAPRINIDHQYLAGIVLYTFSRMMDLHVMGKPMKNMSGMNIHSPAGFQQALPSRNDSHSY